MVPKSVGLSVLFGVWAALTATHALSAPNAQFSPLSGPGCSKIAITADVGAIPPPPYAFLQATLDGQEAPGVAYSSNVQKFPFPKKPGLIVVVPGNAKTGPLDVRLARRDLFGISGPEIHLTFPKPFTVTGTPIKEPVIASFTATPDPIDAEAGGSTLKWKIGGSPTIVELNGQKVGQLSPLQPPIIGSSAHVSPSKTTTYELAAGTDCLSVAKEVTVAVQPNLTISVSPNPVTIYAGTSQPVTVTIPPEADQVDVSCYMPVNCQPVTIPKFATTAQLTITPSSLGANPILIHAKLENSKQTAQTSLLVNVPVLGGDFLGPLQFTNARAPGQTSPAYPAAGDCRGTIATAGNQVIFYCPGYSVPPAVPFNFQTDAPVGGLDSYQNLFVVADLVDANTVAYHTFLLPGQLGGGQTITPSAGVSQDGPFSNVPSFEYSQDGTIAFITWSVKGDGSPTTCRNTFLLYDLSYGKPIAQHNFTGATSATVVVQPGPSPTYQVSVTAAGGIDACMDGGQSQTVPYPVQ